MPAYFEAPGTGAVPGFVVVSTIFGVDDELKAIAGRLSGAGFAAAAPDMFWRDDPGPVAVGPEGHARATARSGRFDREVGMGYLAAVIADLRARPQCNGKVAVIGFCFGGSFALLAAARLGTDAGISFHGTAVGGCLDEIDGVDCPLSFHYGDNDAIAPMDEINEIKKAFERLDDAELCIYPGAGHGYMFPSRGEGYDPAAAEASWQRAIAVLQRM